MLKEMLDGIGSLTLAEKTDLEEAARKTMDKPSLSPGAPFESAATN